MNNKKAKWVRIPLSKYNVLQHGIMNLYWDFDRLSSAGQEVLENIAYLLEVPTEKEMNDIPFEQHKKNLLKINNKGK